jgi:hypothetical protein
MPQLTQLTPGAICDFCNRALHCPGFERSPEVRPGFGARRGTHAIDAHLTRSDHYRKVLELLDRAHHDISMEGDNATPQGPQGHIIDELDRAHQTVAKLQEKYN